MANENEETVRTSVESVTYNTLDSLLGGVYEAVVNAQSTISKANMDIWRNQHFNRDGSPKTIKIDLPGGSKDIPTVILVPASNIGIKDVSFEMEMKLNINAEINRDLDSARPISWDDAKSIGIKKGWLRTNDEWGLPIQDGLTIRDGLEPSSSSHRFLYQYGENNIDGRSGTYALFKPGRNWGGDGWMFTDKEPDLRKNKAFKRWLELNDIDPIIFGLSSYINTSIGADSSARGEGEMAKITVKFEGKDIPEGIARLNDLWVKTLPSS